MTNIKAMDLLAEVVATRELEREAYDLHCRIEEFINQPAAGEQAETSDELAAFEKWRHDQADSLRRCGYRDGAEAFIGLGSVHWAGWQARSSLAAPPAAANGDDRISGLRWVIARCAVMQEQGFERVLLKAFKHDLEVALDAIRAQAGEGGEV